MNYIQLEQALNTITTGSITNGPFYGYATAFELLFRKYTNNPDQLATRLSRLLIEIGGVGDGTNRTWTTVESYALKMKKTPYTIRKWCREKKIPSARRVGHVWIIG